MSMVGADITALRALAASLRTRRNDIESARLRVAATIDALSWSGPDHDEFLHRWHDIHLPRIDGLIAELDEVASNATYYAARQEQASGSW